jgi:hypothetical protein
MDTIITINLSGAALVLAFVGLLGFALGAALCGRTRIDFDDLQPIAPIATRNQP